MVRQVFNELMKSKTFLYTIGTEYYYIGSSVFLECDNNQQKKLLSDFNHVLGYIQGIKDEPQTWELKPLVDILSQMLDSLKLECNYKNESKAAEKLFDKLVRCSDDELKSLLEQKKAFVCALNYNDSYTIRTNQLV